MIKNFVPLPYRRVAVREADFPLNEQALAEHLLGREAYRRTEFIVLKRGAECAIARIEKERPDDLFSPITQVEWLSPPDECRMAYDPHVDVGNPSQLAAKARALGLKSEETLIVHGKYEHVNFIFHPDPIVIRVVDVIPPEPAKLWSMALEVLGYAEDLPAIELRYEPIDLVALAKENPAPAYLFPCQASGIDVGAPVLFLDTRPAERPWKMIGCERSAQFHRHFYGSEPDRVDFCPKNRTSTSLDLVLTKCCLFETEIECEGNRALVPWGANQGHVEQALRYLATRANAETQMPLAETVVAGDC